MNIFRQATQSKAGKYIALVLLALIGLAFAAGDITGNGGMSVLGPTSAEVAKVGGQTLSVNELQSRTQRVFERIRQDKPTFTMAQFLAQGGMRQVADELISVKSLIAYGAKHGMVISKKLIDAEIAGNPAFADATGNFSQTQFTQLLAQQRVSEKELRDDIAGQIIQQHILGSAGAGTRTPPDMVKPYAAMLLEQRSGGLIAIPAVTYAPALPPTPDQLKAFFTAHPEQFTIPEQRKLRYALIGREQFDAQAAPTDAEIAQAYKSKAADYAARESRDFAQLILPTQAQAKDIAAKAAGGKSLNELATAAGLAITPLKGLDQDKLAAQTSNDIAKSAFTATKGTLIGPIKAPLGWTLLRVEDVRTVPGKSLEQAKAEIVPMLREAKAKALFADVLNKIDGKIGDGATLAEIVKANNLTIVETPLITASGRAMGDAVYKPDAVVTALLKPGFAMSPDDDPQIVAVKPDEQAAIVVPGDVVPAGPPPFAQAQAAVEIAWRLNEGMSKARAVATQIVAAINKGTPIDAALKQAGAEKAPRQPVSVRRVDISQQGRIPAPMKALFTLRSGAATLVPMDNGQGFMIVTLDKIVEQDPTGEESLMRSTSAGLANVLGGEYSRQLILAIEKELNVVRNPVALASVEAELRKANGAAQ